MSRRKPVLVADPADPVGREFVDTVDAYMGAAARAIAAETRVSATSIVAQIAQQSLMLLAELDPSAAAEFAHGIGDVIGGGTDHATAEAAGNARRSAAIRRLFDAADLADSRPEGRA